MVGCVFELFSSIFLFVFMDVKREKLFHSFFSSTSVLNLLLSDLLIFFTSFSQLMIRA